jgi:hypothetical protein
MSTTSPHGEQEAASSASREEPDGDPQPGFLDYGVRVPENLVTVEVTVWHWESYAAWHRMYTAVNQILSARMRKGGISRSVRILLPIGSPQELVRWLWSHEFCSMITANESGAIETKAGAAPRPIRVTWNPMLQFENNERIDWAAVAANGGTCVVGPGHAYSISVNPCIDDDDRHSHPCVVR